MLLAVTGDDALLADNPLLARSIRNRFPYLEPLHDLQVEMLRRRREGDDDELTRRNIQLTINGIATALRNSGSAPRRGRRPGPRPGGGLAGPGAGGAGSRGERPRLPGAGRG